MEIFDRKTVRFHRDRSSTNLSEFDFLFREIAERLLDRLDDITYKFPTALDLGARNGLLAELVGERGGIETLIQGDLSSQMLAQTSGQRVVTDEEFLPFKEQSFDLIMSCLNLHWVNDLPGALVQIRKALKPDGLFLGALFGGETLKELRDALERGESEAEGGVSPRVSPFVRTEDLGQLLQRAGFNLPVVDIDTVTVSYGDIFKLFTDLRGMGESNAIGKRRKGFTPRKTLMAAAQNYLETYTDQDDRVPATFQVLFISAWSPSPKQPTPLKRGSSAMPMADSLELIKKV
ncbi:MAG: methyltransferase domain-containing protein [Rhodospirillales bacterium]|nr:methyltransferase domain-containing protein [Rhodospirillales bacterium]